MKILGKLIKYLLLLAFLLVGISFAALNTEKITLDLWLTHLSLPLSLVVAMAILAGVLLSSLYYFFPLVKRKGQVRYLSGKLNKLSEK